MSNLTVTPTDVGYSESGSENSVRHTKPAAAAINAGQYAHMDTAGKIVVGNATDAAHVGVIAKGIVIKTVANAGETTTIVSRGIVDLGAALNGMAIDDPVYLSDTTGGILATSAGTVSTVVGYVYGVWTDTTVKKVLFVTLQ